MRRDKALVHSGRGQPLATVQIGDETLTTRNRPEQLMRDIWRRRRVVGTFQDGKSVLMPVAALWPHIAARRWGTKRYL